jgi:hypothetical protein
MQPQPFFSGTPEEIEAEMNRRADLHRASYEDRIRRVDRTLMESLSAEDLHSIGEIIGAILSAEQPGEVASHYQGVIRTVQKMKYGVCTGCGEKHDDADDFLRQATAEVQVKEDADLITEQMTAEFPAKTEEKLVDELFTPEELQGSDQYEAELALWGLRRWGLGLYCVACGKQYPSLEDRKRRPVGIDGCFGCQEKSAHG